MDTHASIWRGGSGTDLHLVNLLPADSIASSDDHPLRYVKQADEVCCQDELVSGINRAGEERVLMLALDHEGLCRGVRRLGGALDAGCMP
jgi:hypothetical protein